MTQKPILLALAGYARSGKDTLALPFMERGFVNIAFSSVIKEFFNPFTHGDEGIPDLRRRMQAVNPDLDIRDWTAFHESVVLTYDNLDVTISAFTEDNAEKQALRPILERGGELIYDYVFREYFRRVDAAWSAGKSVINTRIVKPREAAAWKQRKGLIMLVDRKDWPAATAWEMRNLEELKGTGLINGTLYNYGNAADWDAYALDYAERLLGQRQEAV